MHPLARPPAHRAPRLALLAAAAFAVVIGCGARGGGAAAQGERGLALQIVARGLDHPVDLQSPPGDPRLFVVEQPGRIRVIVNGILVKAPFLDLTDRVRWGGERGLLGLAFHPRYATNGLLFVNYTDRNGDTQIERYHVSADPDRADRASAHPILHVVQPYSNHNGGCVAFGPDTMLWIGMGDGGSGGDPLRNGQNRHALLAKLLRIDVGRGDPYAIPRDNPFANDPSARPEVWALGLRNPWRFSFDAPAHRLYIGDVGQNRWEEIDVVPSAAPGLNFGWNVMEGNHCYGTVGCDRAGFVVPALEYDHTEGCSVTGGVVYRGRRMPWLDGTYFYADYCEGWVRSFRYDGHTAVERRAWDLDGIGNITSFGRDAAGELYVLGEDGGVARIVPRPDAR